jgi:hypothetical protein
MSMSRKFTTSTNPSRYLCRQRCITIIHLSTAQQQVRQWEQRVQGWCLSADGWRCLCKLCHGMSGVVMMLSGTIAVQKCS